MANWYVGSTKYTAVAQWAALTTLAVGAIRRQLAAPSVGNERCFRVSAITTGITGASEPSWNLGAGATTTDTGVTWTECTGVANQNGDGGGTAWAAPHARLANAFASGWMAAGDIAYVSNNHAETQASAITLLSPGSSTSWCQVICVSDTTVPPIATATTATISATGANGITLQGAGFGVTGQTYYYGIGLLAGSAANSASIGISNANFNTLVTILESCTFNLNNTNSGSIISLGANQSQGGWSPNMVTTKNCSYLFGATSQSIGMNGGPVSIIGGSVASTGSVPTVLFTSSANSPGSILVRDVDLSTITGSLSVLSSGINIQFINNKLGGGVTPVNGTISYISSGLKIHNSDSANTNYRYYYANFQGTAQSETTVVRTGGATNGTTPISWNMASTSGASFSNPFVSEDISVWNTNASGSQTATIFLITNTTLDNTQFWAEAEYLGTSSFPLGLNVASKAALLASGSTLTSDSSTWGGAITNKYKIVLTWTPTQVGVLKVRFYLAKPSVTVYVDPEIVISNQTSGRQYMIPGGTFHNDASSSGGSTSMVVHPGLIGGMHG